jgi:hypothetical protein
MRWDEFKEAWFWRGSVSHWIKAYVLLSEVAMTLVSPWFEYRSHDGTYSEARWAEPERVARYDLAPAQIFGILLFWAVLLWFTFLSKSKRGHGR